MSTTDLDEALRLVQEQPDESFFVGERDEELVAAAERALGLAFPPTYRRFVRELGAGNVGAEEIYGVTTGEFVDSSVPNAIWLTLQARGDWSLPESMVVVYFDGMSDYFVLDTARAGEDGEAPVLVWQPGESEPGDELEQIAPDFGSFLLATARDAFAS